MNQCINTNAVYKIIPYFPFHDIYLSLLLFVFLEEKSFVICGVWICWSEFGCVNMPEDCMFWKEDKQLSLRSPFTVAVLILNTCDFESVVSFWASVFLHISIRNLYLFFFFIVVGFVIHWNESAMDLQVFPIPIPPPTRSLVHQVRALVSCIEPGLVICETYIFRVVEMK